MALLLNGSGAEKGSIFVVFLKNSSEEALNGSTSLNGSPPKGSITFRQITVSLNLNGQTFQIGLSNLSWRGIQHITNLKGSNTIEMPLDMPH